MGSEGNRVVVVGGGIGGALVAKTLQSTAHVTLIDPGNMRAIVEPSFAERSVVFHSEYFTNGKLVTSHAANITDTEVVTVDGEHVPYDYLIVATGGDVPLPKTRGARLKEFEADNEKVKAADSILIVGGGPSGVELAAEIAVDFPKKKLTLVHKGSRLLEFANNKASRKALEWLVAKKVNVILEQTVDLNSVSEGGKTTYKTSNGESIIADCHFLCIGKPFGSWIRQTVLATNVDNQGQLMVDENLRVHDRKNIFAVGDITDVPGIKQGYLAQEHAKIVVKNINLLINGGDTSKMAAYLFRGRKEAIAQFPFMTVRGWVPGKMKSKDLFVGKVRALMGLKS